MNTQLENCPLCKKQTKYAWTIFCYRCDIKLDKQMKSYNNKNRFAKIEEIKNHYGN